MSVRKLATTNRGFACFSEMLSEVSLTEFPHCHPVNILSLFSRESLGNLKAIFRILYFYAALFSSLLGEVGPRKVGTFDSVGDANPRQKFDLYLPGKTAKCLRFS